MAVDRMHVTAHKPTLQRRYMAAKKSAKKSTRKLVAGKDRPTKKVPAGIRINLIGHTYGRLTVIAFAGYRGSSPMWQCKCECGNKSNYYRANLRSGNSKQCLSCNRQQLIDQSSSHGMHRTPTYRAWERIVRSENVCRRWAKFENFFADMGKRPSVNHHLVRTSTSKQWQPSNAEWMHKTKARRRPSNRGLKIKYKGRVQSLAAWAREIGISSTSLRARLNNPEWTRKETFEVGATR